MNAVVDTFSAFAATSWRASWLIVAVLGLRLLARRHVPAQVWCVAWLLVAVRLLLPFSVPAMWSPFAAPIPAVPDANLVSPRAITAADVIPTPRELPTAGGTTSVSSITSDRTEPVPPKIRNQSTVGITPTLSNSAPVTVEWSEILAAVWLVGVGLFGLTRIVAALRLSRQLHAARPIADERVLGLIRREVQALGSNAAPAGCETDAVEAPALCGLLRPRLLFPHGLIEKLSDEELQLVVRHELGHWRRRDLATQALVHAAAVLHWWNPLVWVVTRLARTDCELACDELVLRRESGASASAYGAALLKVLAVVRLGRRPAPVVAILEGRHELAHRLQKIADYRGRSPVTVLVGIMLMGALAGISLTRETRAQPGTATAPSASVSAAPAPAAPSVLFKKSADGWTVVGDRADRERLLRQLENTGEFGNARVFILNTGQIVLKDPKDLFPPAGNAAPPSMAPGVELSPAEATQVLKASLEEPTGGAPTLATTPTPSAPILTEDAEAKKAPGGNAAVEQMKALIEKQRQRVDLLAHNLQDFKEKNGLTSLDQRRDMMWDTLKSANAEVVRTANLVTAAETQAMQIHFRRSKGAALTELPFIAEQSEVGAAMARLATMNANLADLQQRYRDRHPKLIEATKQVAEAKDQLAQAVEAVCARLDADLEGRRRNAEQAKQQFERLQEESRDFDRVVLEYNERQRGLNTQEQILTSMAAQATGLKLGQARPVPTEADPARGRDALPPAADAFTISVIGAVNNQSGVVFGANEKPMVLDAIARAGGFAANANRAGVRLIRTESGERKSLTFAEDDLMNGAGAAGSLQRGDVVIVPEQPRALPRSVTIFGAVNKPGYVPLPEPGLPKLTIVGLIALAGGPSRLADLKRVQITRVNATTRATQALTVNVADFMRGGTDVAAGELEPGDMVMVPERLL
jgi:beta-lactamase regulating signal transducer with metallopeptidase domain/protein involved in polysaccharide export with SLBB domain